MADSGDVPIANAEVSFPDLKLSARSDNNGNFIISGVPAGPHALLVRLVGYEPYAATLTFRESQKIEADFVMKRIVTKLAKVNVKAAPDPRYAIRLADFEERRRVGTGRFLTADVFEKAVGQNMSQVLVSLVPGVRTVGRSTKQVLVSRRGFISLKSQGDCAVQVIVNGLTRFNGREENFDLNSLYTADVVGVEYYTVATTPLQFSATSGGVAPPSYGSGTIPGGSQCGTIVIWTK